MSVAIGGDAVDELCLLLERAVVGDGVWRCLGVGVGSTGLGWAGEYPAGSPALAAGSSVPVGVMTERRVGYFAQRAPGSRAVRLPGMSVVQSAGMTGSTTMRLPGGMYATIHWRAVAEV